MAGSNLWLVPLPELASQLANRPIGSLHDEIKVGCSVIQARAVLEASVRQERLNEDMLMTNKQLVEQTRLLVDKTKWVAIVTGGAAVVAAAAVLVAAVIGS
jgi:hypothetical protein